MNLQQRLELHLKQGVVGFPTALATAIGVVMASPVILSVTTGFGTGGTTFVLAMLIAFVMMMAQATSFAEAATLLPTAGSVYDYIACGMGRFFAITGTLSAYMLVHVFAGTAETVTSGVMATVNFDVVQQVLVAHQATWVVGVGLVLIFATLNCFGITAFGRVEVLLTAFMWTTLTVFGVLGVLHPPRVALAGWLAPALAGHDVSTVLSMVGLAMFMFLGLEFVTPLAPELKHANRTIPRAMLAGLVLVATCMLLWGTAMSRQVINTPLDPTGSLHLLDTPDAIPVLAHQLLGNFGKAWIGIAFLLTGAATINTLMASLPRILYGMAVDGALPRCFTYLHPRFRSPLVGIAVAAAIPIAYATVIKGDLDRILPLVLAAVCSWGVAYLLVNISIVLLRWRRADLPRAFRSPWFPLPQLVSSIGILLAIWYITPIGMDPRSIYVPFGLMLGLTALYALVWTRFVQRVPPFEAVAVEAVLEKELGKYSADGARP